MITFAGLIVAIVGIIEVAALVMAWLILSWFSGRQD